MSEWITDYHPTDRKIPGGYSDRYVYGSNGHVYDIYDDFRDVAWQYIPLIEEYVNPYKWQAVYSAGIWNLWNGKVAVNLNELTDERRHAKTAERIAAIYNEVMP